MSTKWMVTKQTEEEFSEADKQLGLRRDGNVSDMKKQFQLQMRNNQMSAKEKTKQTKKTTEGNYWNLTQLR